MFVTYLFLALECGPQCRRQNVSRERHAMRPRKDRNEVAKHVEQSLDQRADFPVLSKKALRAQQVLFTQQDVLAVALDEGPADELSAVVVGKRADDAAQNSA